MSNVATELEAIRAAKRQELNEKVYTIEELEADLRREIDRRRAYSYAEIPYPEMISRLRENGLAGSPIVNFMRLAVALRKGEITYTEVGMSREELVAHFQRLSDGYHGGHIYGMDGWALLYMAMLREPDHLVD